MRPSALLGALAVAAVLAWGFAAITPASPGVYVAVLTAGTFGFGPVYGAPTDRLVDRPWRRLHRVGALARRLGTRWLAHELTVAGWNRRVRRPIRSRADVRAFRRDAVGALVSHTVSTAFHGAAAVALAVAGHPGWALVAVALGLLVHAWPALLQVELLVRVDELRAVATRRPR
ncbi:hypothetical protein E4A47_11260 [Micrococcus flavus]|uniref:Uncharacterized protein n=1 Tax=Micrococcus flavus TaxID=384602 RepID=A0A4Y8WUT4_9MICC|nr:hypothetical protein [Micrococcus flavus]MBB4881662.1 hypothetical protein [Micrococcus flavus]TFH98553.1 hypothetical protein E4A47_11260 [Micrococcus flavus]GGK55129.1 hypothetical protein GCM10007073_22810 [Micrococcus flavus]